MNRNVQLLWNGLIPENPIFRLALSMCPAVAVTTSVQNGLMLGLAVVFVQVFSSCTVAIFKSSSKKAAGGQTHIVMPPSML